MDQSVRTGSDSVETHGRVGVLLGLIHDAIRKAHAVTLDEETRRVVREVDVVIALVVGPAVRRACRLLRFDAVREDVRRVLAA